MKLVFILFILAILLFPSIAAAQNAVTTGSISIVSTFRSIGVVSSYSGDDNNNSQAILGYKEKNAIDWKQAHPMSLVGGDRIRKQWAVSIVMLNPDTDYDVRVTYTDSDGVSGTNPATASIRTRGENWPTGTGTTYYVSTTGSDTNPGTETAPFRTIQKAASVVSPGSTVFIRGGTYRETVTLTRGGTASAYILFQNYPGETVNIDGSDEAIANGSVTWTSYGGGIYYTDLSWSAIVGDNMGYAAVDGQRMYFYKSKFNTFANFTTDSWVVNRSSWYWNSSINRLYVKLVNIGNPDPATHQMTVARRSLGFYFNGYGSNNPDYTVLKGINVLSHQQFGIQSYQAGNLLIDTCTVSGYGNVGIYSGSGNNITVQNCQVVDGDMRQVPWDALKRTEQETGGIVVKESQGAVIRNNIVEGGMDAIALGGGSSGTWQDDTDVYDNSISKVSDDGMSLDVYNGKNVRAWGNTILGGLSPISAAPVQAGPVYIFRNTVFRTTGAALKLGYNNPSVGPHFLYHNTIYLPDANGGIGVSSYGGDYLRSAVLRNNIVFIGYTASNAYAVYNNFKGSSFMDQWDMNYDDLFTLGSILVRWRRFDISYATLAAFQAGTGEELNGISANPQFVDQTNGDLRLQSTSPAIDKGVVIPNFNDADSAWPYRGTAPDMGAFEFDSGAPSFSFSLSASPSSGTVIQGSSATTTVVTATLTLGTTQSVSFTASGLPTGASYTFSPTSCNPTCSSTLSITTSSTTPTGTYPITITGTGGGVTRNTAYSLTVSSTADTTPPVISSVSASTTVSSATITWLTDDASNSTVNYGLTASLGSSQANTTLVTNHLITLTGLTENTTYYYQVRSCNSNNLCTSSTIGTFTTQVTSDVRIIKGAYQIGGGGGGGCTVPINGSVFCFTSSSYIFQLDLEYSGSGLKNVTIARPSNSVNAINWRVVESGMLKSVNITETSISWTANLSVNNAYLTYQVAGLTVKYSRKIETGTNYQHNFTISSDNSLYNLEMSVSVNSSYRNWRLYWFNSSWIDATNLFRLNISNGYAAFYGFNTSDQMFRIEGSTEVCVDADYDNYYSTVNCTGGNDCNDANAAINPSAAEVCGNGIDDNCDNIDVSCTACPDGSIPSTGCSCSGVNYYSGYCCSNAYQASACTQPSPPPSGGGVVPTSPAVETPITKEPETKEAVNVEESIGAISLELITPDKVESGEMFNTTVWLLSPVTSAYSLTIGDVQQEISLEAGKERLVTIPVRAPESKGVFTLTAIIDGTSRAKDITLDYLPLFLYVNETRVGNETFVNVTVKNYEPMSTELRIIKDGRSDAFFELIEGKKEYSRELKLTQPGEYKIIASASSQGKIIDTDDYLLTVAGEKGSDYRLLMIIVFAFVVMVITLIVMIR